MSFASCVHLFSFCAGVAHRARSCAQKVVASESWIKSDGGDVRTRVPRAETRLYLGYRFKRLGEGHRARSREF